MLWSNIWRAIPVVAHHLLRGTSGGADQDAIAVVPFPHLHKMKRLHKQLHLINQVCSPYPAMEHYRLRSCNLADGGVEHVHFLSGC